MTLLWLDDYRDPMKNDWLRFSPIPKEDITQVVWVKSFKEFKKWIIENGFPDAVCLDHDLCEEHMNDYRKYQAVGINKIDYKSFNERTGLDCARFLIQLDGFRGKPFPLYASQSANPIGRMNILRELDYYVNETYPNKPSRN